MRCGKCNFYEGRTFGTCKHKAGSRCHKDDLCWVFGFNGKKEGVTGPMFQKKKKPESDHMKEEVYP